jgi:hypothetical protein
MEALGGVAKDPMGLLRVVRWLVFSRLLRRTLLVLIRVLRRIGWRRVAHAILRIRAHRKAGSAHRKAGRRRRLRAVRWP